ncbi:MAG: hypothetical protein RM021_024490 [Nostoc sp. EkiNYC01]|nr:hypothetical protein [Nostoc sp. EkiNYC01]
MRSLLGSVENNLLTGLFVLWEREAIASCLCFSKRTEMSDRQKSQ